MKQVTIDDILYRVKRVVSSEVDVIKHQLKAARVAYIPGHARFENEHEISINKCKQDSDDHSISSTFSRLRAKKFLIACGTRPAHSPIAPVDGRIIFDSDQILSGNIRDLPRSLIVVGAGVIGMEYASMLNVVPGHHVTVIDGRPEVLPFADEEIIGMLKYEMRNKGARFLLGETIQKIEKNTKGIKVFLISGKIITGDALLYTVGRQANTDGLNLEAVGLSRNPRGLLTVNDSYQTNQSHIYAAGDCIGAPSLASTSMEQGRLASCHMWGEKQEATSQLDNGSYPYGIYTIPEISMVGQTEQQLTKNKISYEVKKFFLVFGKKKKKKK
jgi:NAD(P) transhydrogenase